MLPFWQEQPHIFCTTIKVEVVVPLWSYWVLWVKTIGISCFHKKVWGLLCSKAMTVFQCFWGHGCCGRILAGKQCPMALPKHNVHLGVQRALREVTWITLAVLLSAITRFPLQCSKPVCAGFVSLECRSDGPPGEPWAISCFSFFLFQYCIPFPVFLNFVLRHADSNVCKCRFLYIKKKILVHM